MIQRPQRNTQSQYDWKSFTLTRKEQLLNLRIRTLQRTNIDRISLCISLSSDRLSEYPSHTELLHQKVSSVSFSAELQFPPTSLSEATQLPPKCVLAPSLCFAPTTSAQRLFAAVTIRWRCVIISVDAQLKLRS